MQYLNKFIIPKKISFPGKAKYVTVPIAEILNGKNARAWVSMVLYLKNLIKIKILKRKTNPGSRLEVGS